MFSCNCTIPLAWSIIPKGLWPSNIEPSNFHANDDGWILGHLSVFYHLHSHSLPKTRQGLFLGDVSQHQVSKIDNLVNLHKNVELWLCYVCYNLYAQKNQNFNITTKSDKNNRIRQLSVSINCLRLLLVSQLSP